MSYAGEDDDDGGGDLLFFALLVAGAYAAAQFLRYRAAAAGGGGRFESFAPQADATQGILNILIPLHLSPTGAAFIKSQEGLRLQAYSDGGKRSIGYGHQIQPSDNIGASITQDEADRLFAQDAAAAERAVSDGLQVQVSQSQFDALVDLAFNIGRSAFLNSTLLQLLNSGDFAGAAAQFGQWVHSGGQISSALQARRAQDFNLFSMG